MTEEDYKHALRLCQLNETTPVTLELLKMADARQDVVWIRDDYIAEQLALPYVGPGVHFFLSHVANLKQEARKSGYQFSA